MILGKQKFLNELRAEGGYFIVPRMLPFKWLRPGAKTLMYLLSCPDAFTPTQDVAAIDLGVSPRTFWGHVKKLEGRGFIGVEVSKKRFGGGIAGGARRLREYRIKPATNWNRSGGFSLTWDERLKPSEFRDELFAAFERTQEPYNYFFPVPNALPRLVALKDEDIAVFLALLTQPEEEWSPIGKPSIADVAKLAHVSRSAMHGGRVSSGVLARLAVENIVTRTESGDWVIHPVREWKVRDFVGRRDRFIREFSDAFAGILAGSGFSTCPTESMKNWISFRAAMHVEPDARVPSYAVIVNGPNRTLFAKCEVTAYDDKRVFTITGHIGPEAIAPIVAFVTDFLRKETGIAHHAKVVNREWQGTFTATWTPSVSSGLFELAAGRPESEVLCEEDEPPAVIHSQNGASGGARAASASEILSRD